MCFHAFWQQVCSSSAFPQTWHVSSRVQMGLDLTFSKAGHHRRLWNEYIIYEVCQYLISIYTMDAFTPGINTGHLWSLRTHVIAEQCVEECEKVETCGERQSLETRELLWAACASWLDDSVTGTIPVSGGCVSDIKPEPDPSLGARGLTGPLSSDWALMEPTFCLISTQPCVTKPLTHQAN